MAHTLAASVAPSAELPELDNEAIHQARIELAACFQLAAQHGLEEGICNHFSALLPGSDTLFLVNPYGLAFAEVTASSLLICHVDGQVLAGQGQPEATAFYIHARLHRQQPRIRAAFHTHMPHATALSMLQGEPLRWAGQTALKFLGRTAVDPHYNGLALDNTEGDRIAKAIGTADIVFLKNHGVLVCGASVAEAWDDLYYLERAAQVQLLAMSTGEPLQLIPGEIAQRTAAQMRLGDADSARAHLASGLRRLRAAGNPFER
ncbi:aldolase [Ideonella azotifigens]|uniref:Aldolase n=1 Tax=Ideonella azotifigens TaxID=513160 RepID=A0ABN1KEV3_9BURK|nr:aldolase [Ideonella azotifigens]MCD2340641.1 aldolase [Ideonella azotifigens]